MKIDPLFCLIGLGMGLYSIGKPFHEMFGATLVVLVFAIFLARK